MKNIKVLVVTHKEFDDSILPKEGYQVIKVGNKLSDEQARQLGYLTDDQGDNISDKNPMYCELTAQYWGWKNLKCDIVGLVHYRRYFMYHRSHSACFADDIMPPPVIEQILENHKVIVPFRTVKPNDSWNLHKGVLPEHDNHDWVIIRDIIFRDYPELKAAFNKIAYSQIYFGLNMMITSKQIYDEYSKFVFDVLTKFDLEYEKEGKTRRARVDGFWSEQLLCIWVSGHFKESEIYWAHIGEAERNYDKYYGKALSCKLKRLLCSNHFCFRLLKTLKLRADLVKYKVRGKI